MHRIKDGHFIEHEYLVYHLIKPQDETLFKVDERRKNKGGRLLCWITPTTTSVKRFEKRKEIIRQTWGRRCDTLLFQNQSSM